MNKRLDAQFYSHRAPELSVMLLGKLLCRRLSDGKIKKCRITETECYFGEADSACHAHKGRTQRTDILYSKGGFAYVYLCYGIHNLLNVVSGTEGFPEAVLIRGVEGVYGPGKLTKELYIDRRFNRENIITSQDLWLEDDGCAPEYWENTRIGIDYADKADRERKWRFTVK